MKVTRRYLISFIVGMCLAVYLLTYVGLRVSGSIAGHVAQGHRELEFQDEGWIQSFPKGVRAGVCRSFLPLMWLETPFLRFYVPEPGGG